MLRCNTLIINNAQQIESGNIPVNLGESENIKVENGKIKIKDDNGVWNTQSNDKDIKVENGVLKYKDSNEEWVDYSIDETVKVEDGDVIVKDVDGNWNKIKGNKYSKVKIDDTKQTLCYSKNTEYEISFNYSNTPD